MEIIRKYLIEERKMPAVVAERTLEKLARHPDISDELKSWIANRTYETNTPVSVEGYTGADIARLAPFMDGVGVFTFLVSLWNSPKRQKNRLPWGFPESKIQSKGGFPP